MNPLTLADANAIVIARRSTTDRQTQSL